MTDTGAAIRAIKLGHPDKIISHTLGITSGTLNIIKKDFEEITKMHQQGRLWYVAAEMLMKEKGMIWYAYHVLDSTKEELEAEILAETGGTPRLKAPDTPPEPGEPGDPEPKEKREPKEKGAPKGKKGIKSDKIDEAIGEEAARPSGEALMEDAGNIGKEIAVRRQEIGRYVETMDGAARDLGFSDLKIFLETIFTYFLSNYGRGEQKDQQIQELSEVNQMLITALDDRNRKAFISKAIDSHVFQTMQRGITIKPENLLAYSQFLEEYIKPVSTDNLLKFKPGEIINGIPKTTT
jgi:hypothetical protein